MKSIVLCCLLLLSGASGATPSTAPITQPCNSDKIKLCTGWSDSACSIADNHFDVSLYVDIDPPDPNWHCKQVFRYCPKVDDFAALQMMYSPNSSAVQSIPNCIQQTQNNSASVGFPDPTDIKNLRIRAFVGDSERWTPADDTINPYFVPYTTNEKKTDTKWFSMPLLQNNPEGVCPEATARWWVPAGMILLNVTFKDGVFTTVNFTKDNLIHNAHVGSGFVPTCDSHGKCLFGDKSASGSDATTNTVCIGGTSKDKQKGMNGWCGKCVGEKYLQSATEFNPIVFLSFAGTDSSDRKLISNARSPMTFRKYAISGLLQDFEKAQQEIQKIQKKVSDSVSASVAHVKRWWSGE